MAETTTPGDVALSLLPHLLRALVRNGALPERELEMLAEHLARFSTETNDPRRAAEAAIGAQTVRIAIEAHDAAVSEPMPRIAINDD